MTIRVVTDSTCDLPAEVVEKYSIEVVPMAINIGDQSYLDGIDMTREAFYEGLPTFPTHPSTGVVGEPHFIDRYQALLSSGADQVLSIHISERLSGVINVARGAAERVGEQVVAFDSGQLSLGLGIIVERAAAMAAAGEPMASIRDAIADLRKRVYTFAGLDTLEYLRRSGRVPGVVAGIGGLINLKPLLHMYDGEVQFERVRTARRVMARVVDVARAKAPYECLHFMHTAAPMRVNELRNHLADLLPGGPEWVVDVTPVIGANLGPGLVAFSGIQRKP